MRMSNVPIVQRQAPSTTEAAGRGKRTPHLDELDLDELARQVQWLYALCGRRVRVHIIYGESNRGSLE